MVQSIGYFLFFEFLVFLFNLFVLFQFQEMIFDGGLTAFGMVLLIFFYKLLNLFKLPHSKFNFNRSVFCFQLLKLNIIVHHKLFQLGHCLIICTLVEPQKAVSSQLVVIDILFFDFMVEDESVNEIIKGVDVDHSIGNKNYFLEESVDS